MATDPLRAAVVRRRAAKRPPDPEPTSSESDKPQPPLVSQGPRSMPPHSRRARTPDEQIREAAEAARARRGESRWTSI